MGKRLGDPVDPLLVSVRSGAKFSMPGMMDTVLNLGPQRRVGRGPGQADRRRALRLRLLPPLHRDVRAHRARHRRRALRPPARDGQGVGRGRPTTPTSPPTTLRRLCERYKDVVRRETGKPFPQDPTEQLRGRHRGRVPARGTAPGPSPTASASASRTTSAPPSTCRRWCSATATTTRGTGVGFTRNAGHRRERPLRRLPRERPGRGRGGRHPQHRDPRPTLKPTSSRGSTRSCWPSSTGSRRTTATCATPSSPSSRASSGCSRPGWASAPAPPRCAWPSRWYHAGHRQDRWKITKDEAIVRRHRRAPRPGAAPAVRGQAAPCSPRAWPPRRAPPSAGSTSPPTTPPTPPTGARRSSSCAARRRPRTCTACRSPRASSPPAAGSCQPRRRRRPGLGHPRRRRRRRVKIDGKQLHRRRRRR